MKKFFAILILSIISQICLAQKQGPEKIDSLLKELKHPNSDTGLINNWVLLASAFPTIFPDSGIYYGNLALDKSVAINNKSFQIASLLALGSNYTKKGNQPKALSSLSKALELSIETNDSLNIGRSYTRLSILYRTMGDISKFADYVERAFAINQKLNNKFEIAWNLLTMASIYLIKKQYHEAIHFYKKALAVALISNNNTVVAYSYSNTAEAFMKLKQFKKALEYQYKALKLEEEMGDKYGVATEYISISEAYSGLSDSEEGVKKAVLLDSAVHYSKLAIYMSYQCDIPAIRIGMIAILASIFKKKNNYKEAFELLLHANALKDSVFSEERKKQLQEIETGKALVSKEKEIEIQKLRLVKSKQLQIAMIIGIALLIGSTFFIYRSFKKQRFINNKLKETQTQLIQQEKLASLGELTAGIAHEIQNPLNFVNNFSEVNMELLIEMKDEMQKGNYDEAKEIVDDVISNEEKINHHGKRADAIVKGMLQHSRSSSGVKEPTDINALADEYLRLAYHGLRAKDSTFNATMKRDFDKGIGKVNMVPQDIGRVLLNLINNAFYAVSEKQKTAGADYVPEVSVTTKQIFPPAGLPAGMAGGSREAVGSWVSICIHDNGPGISDSIKGKIFQPFFTTKPTGEGTGLGLSLSYDIIKAHGGEITVNTRLENGALPSGTEFIITLPCT